MLVGNAFADAINQIAHRRLFVCTLSRNSRCTLICIIHVEKTRNELQENFFESTYSS
jgi:hypothetical protein